MAKAKKKRPTDGILEELRAFGLAYPGAHVKSPWPGHMDLAVKDKTFAYLSVEGDWALDLPLEVEPGGPHIHHDRPPERPHDE